MLDRRTIQLHAVSLAVASWVVLVWTQAVPGPADRFGTLRGVDFVQFYAAGWLVAHGQAGQLYDWAAFARMLPGLVPNIGDLLYLPVYPPQLALAFAGLGQLSYLPALAIWTCLSVALYVGTTWVALRQLDPLGPYRPVAWCLALGFNPFLQLVAHGQIASLAVPALFGAFLAFRSGRPFVAGLALGALAFKPQLGTFALAALVLWPSWRLVSGLAVSGGVQAVIVGSTLGFSALGEYLAVAYRVATSAGEFEPKVWAMHSVRGAIELLVGQTRLATACTLIAVVCVVWLGRRAWWRHDAPEFRFALIGLTGLLVNPHLYVYDLVLLSVPLACLASWLIRRQDPSDVTTQYLAYSLVWLPLLGPLAAVTHIQLTSPALLGLLWQLGRHRIATTHAASA
jgi:hypothetical protein